MELQAGTIVERYVVESELGRGGMAVVYRVRHARLGSLHALKLLSLTSRSLRERLLQEGQVQATLRHPNIVAVTDVLDVDGQPGLIMEYVEGPTLEDWLLTHRPTFEQAERLFRGVLSAVEAAHARDIVHRDLKPANVLLAPYSGEVVPKVTDFGLAKALAESSSRPGTRSGVSMGTPKYMAPEQIRDAGGVDARADLFSLGAILYELVTGQPPFDGPDVLSVFNRVASGSFAPLHDSVPEALRRAIRGCLVVDPDHRIPDCAGLRAVLDGATAVPQQAVAAQPLPPGGGPSATMVPDLFGGTPSSETWSPELASAQAAGGALAAAVRPAIAAPQASQSAASSVATTTTLVPGPGDSAGHTLDPDTPRTSRRRVAWFLTGGGLALLGIGATVVVLILAAVVGSYMLSSWHARRIEQVVAAHTGGEARVGEVALRPGQLLVRGVEVLGRDGQVVARAPLVRLVGQSWWFVLGLDDVDDVFVQGLTIDLRQDEQGWVLPEQTLALLDEGLPAGQVSRNADLQIFETRLTARNGEGVLSVRIDVIDFNELGLDQAGWRADDVRIAGLFVDGAQPIGSVVEVTANGGEARLRGLDVWVRSRRDGRLDLPPVIADGVPAYLGGGLQAGESSWFTHLARAVPVGVDTVRIESAQVHLVDTAHADRDVTWTLDVDQAGGVLEGSTWRMTALGQVEGGRATLDGGLDVDGRFEGRLDVRDLPLRSLSAYLERDLAERQVRLQAGSVQAVFELEEQGEALGWQGLVELDDVQLAPLSDEARLSARERRLLVTRERVDVAVDGLGVLSDPAYQPVEDVRVATVEALLAPAGRMSARRRFYGAGATAKDTAAAESTASADPTDAQTPDPSDPPTGSAEGPAAEPTEAPGEGPATEQPDAPDTREPVRIPESMREAWKRRREEGRKKLEDLLKGRR